MAAATPAGEPGRKLHREQIITVALALLDEAGFNKLTVRNLAAKLHVQPAALYWHVKNKQELIDAMAAAIMPMRDIERVNGWRELLAVEARAVRDALMRHRDGAQVIAHANITTQGQALAAREATFKYLVDQGFSLELAASSVYLVMRFTLGCVFEEQADPRTRSPGALDPGMIAAMSRSYPTLVAAYNVGGYRDMQHALDEQFERSLDLVLDGIQVRLDASHKVS